MTHAGRFLWLDRADQVLEYQPQPLNGSIWATAQHDGYRKLGLVSRRKVCWDKSGWQVEDDVISRDAIPSTRDISVTVNWLMPDCPWQIFRGKPTAFAFARLGWLGEMIVVAGSGSEMDPGRRSLQLVHAGALLFGEGEVDPTWGWRSQTYGNKEPTLSFRYSLQGMSPLHLVTAGYY